MIITILRKALSRSLSLSPERPKVFRIQFKSRKFAPEQSSETCARLDSILPGPNRCCVVVVVVVGMMMVVGMMIMVVVEGLWRQVMFRFRFRFHRHPHHLSPGFLLLPLLPPPLLLLLLQDEKGVPPTWSNPSSTANPPDCTIRHLAAVFSSPLLSSCGVCYSVSELPWAHP